MRSRRNRIYRPFVLVAMAAAAVAVAFYLAMYADNRVLSIIIFACLSLALLAKSAHLFAQKYKAYRSSKDE